MLKVLSCDPSIILFLTAESLRAIVESVAVSLQVMQLPAVPVKTSDKLQRKTTLQLNWTRHGDLLQVPGHASIPRNASETQLTSIRTVGEYS